MRRKFLLFLILLFYFFSARGEVKKVGFSFVNNYSKETYGAGTQVWSISQDRDGIMYFGNNSGLLSFDGADWRLYPIPNKSIVRAVRAGDDRRIYIGAFNEFGYFSPDEKGELSYHSLLGKIPSEYRDFGEVWHIIPYNDGYLFNSFSAIFFYKDDEVNILDFNRNLHFSFYVDNELYIKETGVGILHLKNDTLGIVQGSDFFADISVSAIISYYEKGLLIVTREHGLYLFNDGRVRLFNTPLQEFCRINQVYTAILSDAGFLVLGTVQNGVIILDRDGNLIQHLNHQRGLQNNTVLSLFMDISDNLWMGLDNGIDYILLDSPLSYFVHEREIGAAYVVEQKGDDLFIGTNQGLYHCSWPSAPQLANGESSLNFVKGSQGQVWTLQNRNNLLLVGHDKGTFIADRNLFKPVNNTPGGWGFIDIPNKNDMLLEGTYSGMLTYRYVKKGQQMTWEFSDRIKGFNESCRQIQFDERGFLWIGHDYRGIFRLRINDETDSVTRVKHFTEFSGLPSNYNLNLLKFNNRVIVCSDKGIYVHNEEKDMFEKDQKLSELFENRNVHTLIEDDDGNIWYFSNNATGILKSNFDGTYSKTSVPFNPLHQKVIETYENVLPIDKSNILFCTEEGVIHFDPTFEKDYEATFNVMIRNVQILPDSFIYRGYKQTISRTPEIKFRYNAIRLSFSAVFFEFPSHIQYSYMLEGFEPDWGEWASTTEKEYTNLHEGEYTFQVKARNIYGLESKATPYTFIVLPPWYRSLAAYLGYAVLFLLAIVLTAIYVVRKIEHEKQQLKEKQKLQMKERERLYAAEAIKAEQEIIKLQNEKLEIEYQKNKTELESKTKELASIAMQITYKNELLAQIQNKLTRVSNKMIHQESKQQVESLVKTLEKDIIGKDEWEKFEVHFDQVHEDFMKKLRNNYPELTPKDLKLCAYLRMNLSSKEIAPLLNISIRGVEISRYRLRKKLRLPHDANLTDFMMHL